MSTDESLTESNDGKEIEAKIINIKRYIHQNFETLREEILNLAKKLDKDKICKEDEICNRIKEYLKDEIQNGKITSRWIEGCLPKEYKRKYEKKEKSEVSSLSTDNKKRVLVKTDGSTSYEHYPMEIDNNQTDGFKNIELEKNNPISDPLKLNEPSHRENHNFSFPTEDKTKIVELRIPKDREHQIKESFDKCKEYIIIRLDEFVDIISIESDIEFKDVKDIDKYHYDDNDTNHDGESV